MPITPNLFVRSHEGARPIAEPLSVPRRSLDARRRRISVSLDQERYVAFRLFAAIHGLSGDQVAVIAIDRLMADHATD